MEDALVHSKKTTIMNYKNVLILVLMEDALVRMSVQFTLKEGGLS